MPLNTWHPFWIWESRDTVNGGIIYTTILLLGIKLICMADTPDCLLINFHFPRYFVSKSGMAILPPSATPAFSSAPMIGIFWISKNLVKNIVLLDFLPFVLGILRKEQEGEEQKHCVKLPLMLAKGVWWETSKRSISWVGLVYVP